MTSSEAVQPSQYSAAARRRSAMRATRTTPAAVLTVAALAAALVTAAAVDVEVPQPQYVATLHKGSLGARLAEPLGTFYIPEGQCSGVLDDLLRCGSGSAPAAVRVSVADAARFPLVALRDSLRRASVLRAQPCLGEASVTVQLACL